MNQIVTATFENGLLKPHEPLNLSPGSKVRLIVEPLGEAEAAERDWQELEKLWEETSVDSGGQRMTRDELHERD